MPPSRSSFLPLLALGLLGVAACDGGDYGDNDDVAVDGGNPDATVDAPLDAPPAEPQTTITVMPASLTNQAMTRFEFASSISGSTFDCVMDGGAAFPCSSPYQTALLDGPHTFEVAATSPEGVADPSPAQRAWLIDTQPPVTTIVIAPAAFDNSVNARFEFTSELGATFACALDGAPASPCGSPYETAALADGPHTFEVGATDAAGNVEPPHHLEWTLDRGPPDTVIDSSPPAVTTATDATFTFSSPDAGAGATFTCRRGATAAVPCISPWTVSGLTDGTYSVSIAVRDAAGNVDPSPATRTWRVDTTPPTVQITAGLTGPMNDPTPQFYFERNGSPVSTECRITGSGATDFAPCTSPFTAAALPDGPGSFVVRVRDAVGLEATDERAFVVDTVAPVVTITSGPTGIVTTPQATVTFTVSEPASVACRVGTWEPCNNGTYTTPALNEGPRTILVHAVDAAGNHHEVTRSFIVDSQAPMVTITAGPTGPTADATPTFAFQVPAGGSAHTVSCQIDQLAAVTPCASPFTPATLGDGPHVLAVTATDGGGHSGSATRTFSVDTTPLTVTITASPTGVVTTRQPSVSFVNTGLVVHRSCRIDSGLSQACSVNATSFAPTFFLADGPHTYTIEVMDDTGATASATSPTFTIDSTAPAVTFTSGPDGGEIVHGPVTYAFTVGSDAVATECRFYSFNINTPYQPCTSPVTVTPFTPHHTHHFEVRVRDVYGNQQTYSRFFGYVP